MIFGAGVRNVLESIGHYVSGPGGAGAPAIIGPGFLLFELITEGTVYGPDSKELHGVGAVFAHCPGQSTVFRVEGTGHYACMTARFYLRRLPRHWVWPRFFQWREPAGALHFAEEMLFAFHHTDQDRQVLGEYVLSQFRFRLEEFRRTETRRAMPQVVANVLNHIDRNFAEPSGIESLAERFGLSASHLHALFRQHLGVTPHQHLILQRMRTARHRLVTTNDPIKSIARDVGYSNTENFCRAFRQHCGFTAASYRRKFQPHR